MGDWTGKAFRIISIVLSNTFCRWSYPDLTETTSHISTYKIKKLARSVRLTGVSVIQLAAISKFNCTNTIAIVSIPQVQGSY